jgi:hypothetical protein
MGIDLIPKEFGVFGVVDKGVVLFGVLTVFPVGFGRIKTFLNLDDDGAMPGLEFDCEFGKDVEGA